MNLPAINALAAANEHPMLDMDSTVFVQLILFFIVWAAAAKLLFKPYLKMRDERTAGVDGAREQAVRMSAEADAQLEAYKEKLAIARNRGNDERRKVRSETAAKQRELSESVRAEVTDKLAKASDTLESETEAARAELLPKADELGAEIASKLLGREVAR